MADDTPARGRSAIASGAAGLLIGGAAAVFVARTLLRHREEIRRALQVASPGWVVLGFALGAVGMLCVAWPWKQALRLFGADIAPGQVVARYFVGEIGKYLPGGVWPVVGRGELARRRGLRRAAAYGSVALSLGALYLAAMLVVVAGLPVLLSGDDGTGPVAVLLLLPVGLACLHPWVLGGAVGLLERVTGRRLDLVPPSWRESALLVSRYVPAWLVIGTATWAVARSLDPSADLAHVGAAAVLSWVVGFALVPVPGGIGVREAAFVAGAGSLEPGIAAATAVTARVIFVTVDALGAVIGSLALGRASTGPDL